MDADDDILSGKAIGLEDEPSDLAAALIAAGWSPEAAEVDAASGLSFAELKRRRINRAKAAEWQIRSWPTWEGRHPWWSPAYAIAHIHHAKYLPPDWREAVGAPDDQSLRDAYLSSSVTESMGESPWSLIMAGWYRAWEELNTALAAGAVTANGLRRLGEALADEEADIRPGLWARAYLNLADASATIEATGERWEHILISGNGCASLWLLNKEQKTKAGQAPPKMEVARRGPRPKWDWEGMLAYLAAVADRPDGLPERQADLEKMGAEWFRREVDDEPAESSIRERASKVMVAREALKADK